MSVGECEIELNADQVSLPARCDPSDPEEPTPLDTLAFEYDGSPPNWKNIKKRIKFSEIRDIP